MPSSAGSSRGSSVSVAATRYSPTRSGSSAPNSCPGGAGYRCASQSPRAITTFSACPPMAGKPASNARASTRVAAPHRVAAVTACWSTCGCRCSPVGWCRPSTCARDSSAVPVPARRRWWAAHVRYRGRSAGEGRATELTRPAGQGQRVAVAVGAQVVWRGDVHRAGLPNPTGSVRITRVSWLANPATASRKAWSRSSSVSSRADNSVASPTGPHPPTSRASRSHQSRRSGLAATTARGRSRAHRAGAGGR